jgi:hypothetical protein
MTTTVILIERASVFINGYVEERVYVRTVPPQHVHREVLAEITSDGAGEEWTLGESGAIDAWFDYLNEGNHAPIIYTDDAPYPLRGVDENRTNPGTVLNGPCVVVVLRYEM